MRKRSAGRSQVLRLILLLLARLCRKKGSVRRLGMGVTNLEIQKCRERVDR